MQKLGDLLSKIRTWFKKEEHIDEGGDDNLPSTALGVFNSSTGNVALTSMGNAGWVTTGPINTAASQISMSTSTYIGSNWSITNPNFTVAQPTTNSICFHGNNNQEIVRLNRDGTVQWANEINVDEAAAAFARAFTVGGELAAGITSGVKSRMRDSIFEDLITTAKEKGPLSADDLTFLLEGTKIMEKLKGSKE